MPALKVLILDHNLLTYLPEDLCELQQLRTFSAVANHITNIPESIGYNRVVQRCRVFMLMCWCTVATAL